jgi:hypothetical protein
MNYVGIYSMLFDPIRHRVRNITEIGAHRTQATQCGVGRGSSAARAHPIPQFCDARLRSCLSMCFLLCSLPVLCCYPHHIIPPHPSHPGVHNGRSLRMWHKYFPARARIFGVDTTVQPQARDWVRSLGGDDDKEGGGGGAAAGAGGRRVTLLQGDSRDAAVVRRHRLRPGSMDIVIDDGDHVPKSNARTLLNFWPLVRPGGYYIIEDVVTGGNLHGHFMNRAFLPLQRSGFAWLAHNASGAWPLAAVREIYAQHDVFLADAQVGARDFDGFRAGMDGWFLDRVNHNAHLLVIRRRHIPRLRPVQHHFCNDRPRKTGVCAQ